MTDIFVSYDDKDRERARAVVRALERRGWSAFWDRSIPVGKTWWQVIGRALKRAPCVVVLWSRTAVESSWVYEEADDGRKRGILIPILIDPVEPPIGFRSVQFVDLSRWDGSETFPAFQRLIADIEAMIGPPTAAAEANAEQIADKTVRDPPKAAARGSRDDGYQSSSFFVLLAVVGLAVGFAALLLW
jgi:hypothetical protein